MISPLDFPNTNPTIYGREANMHLHFMRILKTGVKAWVKFFFSNDHPNFFFKNLKLKNLICEPYALKSRSA
jgi:hypothetical protein